MGANDKAAATYHPAKLPYTCDYCGEEWRNPISAAMCCDNISNDTRGYD